MRISERFTTEHWRAIDFDSDEGWQKAVEIFSDRISSRFFVPVQRIERLQHAGFVILAIDCLLIETLQQFMEGQACTPANKSKQYFKRCLATFFGDSFSEKTSATFYEHFRCGILHQAEVKSTSLITAKRDAPLVQLTADEKGLIINRRKFHAKVIEAYDVYRSRLADPGEGNLRTKFRRKMDYIAGIAQVEN